MAREEIRGQQAIPEAEKLLKATSRGPLNKAVPPPAAYLALSVQVTDTGLWRVHVMHRNSTDSHIHTNRVDGGEHGVASLRWLYQLLTEYLGDVGDYIP